ncbi:hypothetical protein ACS0TY_030037 [Phlomoides rotata]
MRMFIKFIDERAWRSVLAGWNQPRITTDADNKVQIKRELDWTTDECTLASFNSKALNVIFTSVDISMFKIISNCVSIKDPWDRLQEYCEGSESVRRTKLRMFGTKFENMKMKEDETISSYNKRLSEIDNESNSLGEPISNVRLVNKILRTVPKHFDAKICVIEETNNTNQISQNELVSILKTYEMNTTQLDDNDGKNVVMFKSETSSNAEKSSFVTEVDSDDDIVDLSDNTSDNIDLITKQFKSFLKKKMNKSRGSASPKTQMINSPQSYDKRGSFTQPKLFVKKVLSTLRPIRRSSSSRKLEASPKSESPVSPSPLNSSVDLARSNLATCPSEIAKVQASILLKEAKSPDLPSPISEAKLAEKVKQSNRGIQGITH